MRLHLKLGDFPHDNINLVKQACATNEPFCLIINTGDKDTRGEHWTALYHGSTSGGSKYVDYIDPFASLPYKKGTLDLIKTCGQDWTCNLKPVQDMLDSKACGYHCIYTVEQIQPARRPARRLN